LAPEPDGTRGGEPTEADSAAAAAAVAVAKRAQAGLHSVVLIRQRGPRDKAEAKRAVGGRVGLVGFRSELFCAAVMGSGIVAI
jgi:hypothetical protein